MKYTIIITPDVQSINSRTVFNVNVSITISPPFIKISEPIYCKTIKDLLIYRITSKSYDYLDSIREKSIWKKLKPCFFNLVAQPLLML